MQRYENAWHAQGQIYRVVLGASMVNAGNIGPKESYIDTWTSISG